MRSERQQQLEELFGQLMEHPEDERESFLANSCDGDDDLRASLEALMASDRKAGAFMGRLVSPTVDVTADAPADAAPQNTPADEPFDASGRRLGPYRLQRKIGEGGMSSVFLADRVDGSFQRPVVVKVIRQGMESGDTLRRLRVERQILAGLEHPNIARLYDGGATDEQLPYFVMEWVEGVPIDEHCDQRRLSVDQRLTLFRKVCAAVQYAHQNLVVHRDLKPGNILVTAEGEPKLLDFGIAKLLDSELPAAEPTVPWARLMTPNYASPEQILGHRVTTASDVYSLGVLLYKLLTGVLPRRFEGQSAVEVETRLTSTPVTKPSDGLASGASSLSELAELRSTRPESLRRQLMGDVDRIVLEALHAEPSRRYGSAAALAEDLARYQRGLPVRARPDSLGYRAAKFLRRHRLAVAVATLAAVVLIAGVAALGLQATQIARERDRLQVVVAFVKDIFNVAGEGENLTVRQAVDRSAVVLDLALADQPEIHATLLDITGTVYLDLQQLSQAREQLIKAVDLRRAVHGEDSLAFAESLSTLGVADAMSDDFELGEQRARDALAIYRRHLGPRHADLVRPLINLVAAQCYRQDYEAANEPSALALELARSLLGEERAEFGEALAYRALLATKRGDQVEAEALYREAIELERRYRGERHPNVATMLNNLALVLKKLDKPDDAEGAYRQAIELERDLFGDDHPEVVTLLNNLASLLLSRGDLEQAEATYREAVASATEIFGPGHTAALVTSTGLARVLIEAGRPHEAETLLRNGLGLWTESLDGFWGLAYARSVLGDSLAKLGRATEARPLLESGYRELQAARGDDHPKTIDARRRLEALASSTLTTAKQTVDDPSSF